MNASITIGNRQVGLDHPPFVIAEMSGNHNQSLERALAIVEAAAKSGAHALKLQTYTADTMTLDIEEGEFYIEDPNSLWKGASLHKLYQQAYTPWSDLWRGGDQGLRRRRARVSMWKVWGKRSKGSMASRW